MFGTGNLANGQPVVLGLTKARANAPCAIVLSVTRADLPIFGGVLVPDILTGFSIGFATNASGGYSLNLPSGFPGPNVFYLQTAVLDPANPQAFAFSNAIKATVQ
jgi:hypothetical protein